MLTFVYDANNKNKNNKKNYDKRVIGIAQLISAAYQLMILPIYIEFCINFSRMYTPTGIR